MHNYQNKLGWDGGVLKAKAISTHRVLSLSFNFLEGSASCLNRAEPYIDFPHCRSPCFVCSRQWPLWRQLPQAHVVLQMVKVAS